ncbi:MAG TPA: alpha/beta fold hydrolase, partial [Chthonomonadaceae bacterium]|nr:alpha/beta fold hydrolase [Chthonomonadaceae bacterium]
MKRIARVISVVWLLLITVGVAQAQDQYFDSKSVKIRYIVQGKGEPVVLIHGYTSNIEAQWGKLLEPLSENYKVIALDCRGHGKSDKPTDAKMYGREMGEDVVRLMDHLHVAKAHLVGYSMGAYIAYGLMLIHPDRILTVTLGAGGGIPEASFTDLTKAIADSIEKNRSFEPLIRAL